MARRVEYARAMSAADALDAYARDFVTGDKAASRRNRMTSLRRAVEPFMGRPIASLTKGEIVTRLDEVQSESGLHRPQSRPSPKFALGSDG